jgi:hypothetical protein
MRRFLPGAGNIAWYHNVSDPLSALADLLLAAGEQWAFAACRAIR